MIAGHPVPGRILAAALAVAVIACGSDGPGSDPPPEDSEFTAVGGNQQLSPAGVALPVPFRVRLLDDDGDPVAGSAVSWTVTSGGGTITPASSTTGADGTTEALYTLGENSGTQTVSASIAGSSGIDPVEFIVNALPSGAAQLLTTVSIPANYGIHDTYVRNGIAFVCAWSTGVIIYDVGSGIRGGSPSRPVEVSRLLPPVSSGSHISGSIHNAWWFHNRATGEARYLFLGQEGPGAIGSSSSGDIYVLDVSNLAAPQTVAQYALGGAGAHNFWVDEEAQVLYAAYYNGGVVALDISGTLSGNLASRERARIQPGGASSTFTWGVQVANGSVYAADMLNGLWQLAPASGGLAVRAGGNNVLERFTSDLWVAGNVAYTGTWGSVPRTDSLGVPNAGNVIKVWSLDASGAPSLADSITIPDAGTVSDVQVSDDGALLVVTLERGNAAGYMAFTRTNPLVPTVVSARQVSNGLHTGTLAEIGGRTYLFGARNPPDPALMVWDLTPVVP